MKRGLWAPAVAALAAGVVHAVAGGSLAAGDPIGTLLGHGGARVIVAALAVTIARLFLFFVAPGWTVYVVGRAIARMVYGPPR
jgi:hypothetical protein